MNTVTLTWHNLMTGKYRDEVFTKVDTHLWKDESGSPWTYGIVGWFNVDKYYKNG